MANSIKEVIQRMAEAGMPAIEKGIVVSLNPLRIINCNEIKINLSDASVIVPSGKKELLEVGRTFYFLAVNHGKIYYLLDEV